MRRIPRRLFTAKSPKSGKLRQWEGLVEMATVGPYVIVSVDEGEEESYRPNDKGYKQLYPSYRSVYGDN